MKKLEDKMILKTIFPNSNKIIEKIANEKRLSDGETPQGDEAQYIEIFDIIEKHPNLTRTAEISEYSSVEYEKDEKTKKDNIKCIKIWFKKDKVELLKVKEIPEEYDSSENMWRFYDEIYYETFQNIYRDKGDINIKKIELEKKYNYASYETYCRYYKTIDDIKYGGEIDFNFSTDGKYSKFKTYKSIVKEDKICQDEIKKAIYKLLEKVKEHHHSQMNVSLMPSNGKMQFTKQSIGNDRFDVMAFAIDEYCKGNTALLLAHCNPEHLKTLKKYMKDICYDKTGKKLLSKNYFEKIYNIRENPKLIERIIESGKKAIDSAERVVEYIDLAYCVWICRLKYYIDIYEKIKIDCDENINILNTLKKLKNEVEKEFSAVEKVRYLCSKTEIVSSFV